MPHRTAILGVVAVLVSAVVGACGGKVERAPASNEPATGVLPPTPGDAPRPPPPSPPRPPSDDTATCPRRVLLTWFDVDRDVAWRPALVQRGACTEGDITRLGLNLERPALASYFDLGDGLSDTCKACTISRDTDRDWGPIVGTASDDGKSGFFNYGACPGAVEGVACGRATQYAQLCYDAACGDCAMRDDRDLCVFEVGSSDCRHFKQPVRFECPLARETEVLCGTFDRAGIVQAVRALCSGAAVDAGAD